MISHVNNKHAQDPWDDPSKEEGAQPTDPLEIQFIPGGMIGAMMEEHAVITAENSLP